MYKTEQLSKNCLTDEMFDRYLDYYGFNTDKKKSFFKNLLNEAQGKQDFDTKSTGSQDFCLFRDIVEFLKLVQEKFIVRSGGKERWQVDTEEWLKKADYIKINEALKILGFIDAVVPVNDQPDIVVVFGATYPAMEKRLKYVEYLLEQKLSITKITLVLLSGERYVDPMIDGTKESLQNIAKSHNMTIDQLTEATLIEEIYQKSSLKHNDQVYCSIINTPKGDLVRPTTQTTILELLEWLRINNKNAQKLLFVSNQPHVQYQESVVETLIKSKHEIEVVGQEFSISECRDYVLCARIAIEALGNFIFAKTPEMLLQYREEIQDKYLLTKLKEIFPNHTLIEKIFPTGESINTEFCDN